MIIEKATLKKIFIKADIDQLSAALELYLPKYNITNKNKIAMFLAQYGYETGGFTQLEENLNYTTAERVLTEFPKYFKSIDEAQKAVRNPIYLGNIVYANRFGNNATSDGYKYKGRGYCHLTFKANYEAATNALGIDFLKMPDMLTTHNYACMVGAWYWDSRDINIFADRLDDVMCTKLINGGKNGLDDRIALRKKIMGVL